MVLGLAYYFHTRRQKRARTTDLWLVPQSRLIELTCLIRKRFSVQFAKLQVVWRAQRRSLVLGSADYFKFVWKCRSSLSETLRQAIDQVLNEEDCSWTVFDDSVRIYCSSSAVKEATFEMRLPLNHGPVPTDLTLDLVQEILAYYAQRLHRSRQGQTEEAGMCCLIEDEIQQKFGFEIEEVERVFDMNWEFLPEYDLLIQSIQKNHLVESVPSETMCT